VTFARCDHQTLKKRRSEDPRAPGSRARNRLHSRFFPFRVWERLMVRAYRVIDAESRVLEPFDLWAEYLHPAFRDRAPQLFTGADGNARVRIGDEVFVGVSGRGATGAGRISLSDDTMGYNEGQKGGFDPHARISYMDRGGIDVPNQPTCRWNRRPNTSSSSTSRPRRRSASKFPQWCSSAPTR
jgi:hypothetical protein